MTLLYDVKKTCAICHQEVEVQELMSYTVRRISLDGNMTDFMQYSSLQVCPHCGHVSLDIEEKVEKFERKNYAYENDDLNHALQGADTYALNEQHGLASYLYRLAAWRAIRLNQELFLECMNKSIFHLQKQIDELDKSDENYVSQLCTLVDCFRRAERFEEAKALCEELLKKEGTNNYHKLLNKELKYISNNDSKEHYKHELNDSWEEIFGEGGL